MTAEVSKAEIEVGEDCNEIKHVGDDPDGSYVFVSGDLVGKDVNVECVEGFRSDLDVKDGELKEIENKCVGDENDVVGVEVGELGVENREIVENCFGDEGDGNGVVEGEVGELGGGNGGVSGVEAGVGELGVENEEIVNKGVGHESDGNGVVEAKVGELGGENGGFSGVEAVVGESGVENEEIVNKGIGHESDGNGVEVGELGGENGEIVKFSGVEALVGESGVENCVGGENDVVGVKFGELGVENGEIERSSGDVDGGEAADVVASNNDLEVQVNELGVENGEIVKSCVEGDEGDVVTNNDLGQVGELGVENDEVVKSCVEGDAGDVVMNNDLEGKVGDSGNENSEIVKSCVDGDDVTSNNDLEGQVRELGVGNGVNVRSSVEENDVITSTDGVEVQVGEVGVENGEIVQSSVEDDDIVNKDEVVEVKGGELGVENREIVNDFIGDEGGGVTSNDVVEVKSTRSMVDESNCVSDEADFTEKKCIGDEGDVVNSNDVEVKVGELGVDNAEIVRSSVDGSSCVGVESDVTLSNSIETIVGDLVVENGKTVQSSVEEDDIVTSNDGVEVEVGELGVENGEIVQSSVDSNDAVEVKVGELGVENGEIVQPDVEEKADVVTSSNDVEVKVGELGVENGEIVQSLVNERSCITDGADVVPENNDVEAPVGELNIENKGIVDEADVGVKLGELEAENGEIVQSTVDENSCINDEADVGESIAENGEVVQSSAEENNPISDGADVVTSSKDVDVQVREMIPENDEIVHSSLEENNCIDDEANVVPEGPEDIVEEQNGAAIVESEPQQLDHEVKVEDQIELVLTPNAKENQESHISVTGSGSDLGESRDSGVISPEAGDSHEVTEKSEDKDNLGSNAEFGSSQKCQNMVSEAAEVKSKETLDSQMVTTKSVESEFDQLDNNQETHEVENNPTLVTDEPARDVIESPDSQSVNTISVESRSSQLDNEEEKVAEKIKTDLDNVGETCKNVVSGENTVSKGEVVGIDRSQKSPEISENPENAESLPSPVEANDRLVEEQEVGIGSSLITENSRVSELDDTECQTEVENLDVKNRESVEKLETEVQNDLVGGDSSVIPEVVNVEKLNSVPETVDVENREDQVKGDEARDEKLEINDGIESNGDGTEGSAADTVDGQNPVAEAVARPFHFLIRVPRFDDEKLKEQIRLARLQVDEKTRERDAIRMELPTRRANCQAYGEKFETARSDERAARRLVKLKRQEIDSVQSVISRVKNAVSVEEIDGRIYNMEHAIAHETLELKQEKQLIREIKQLKQLREQLASNMGSEDEMGQRDEIEERLKVLKKELERLKETVSKAEAISGAAGRKYDEESKKLREFQARFKAADTIRQEAYKQFHDLNKQMSEKSKHFWRYRDDSKTAGDLASGRGRDREGLHHHCVDQVERIMELWNKNDEFRADYVRCNLRSTLRRLRTYDGRSLGPDEEPPVIPSYTDDRVNASVSNPVKANTVSIVPTPEQGTTQVSNQVPLPVKGEEAVGKKMEKVSERKNEMPKTKKPVKPSLVNGSAATVTGRVESEVTTEEEKQKEREEKEREKENKKMKELEELAKKEEELRKKESEEKLKEQRRLEEKAKAQEAIERKKRNVEKAQVRAELRAQKEAEQKEKEREKRLKKKEKKKAGVSDPNDGNSDILPAPSSENAIDTTKESSDSKRQLQQPKPGPSYFAKLSKPKASLPPPLRNRGKRRWQQYIWVITAALFCLFMFYLVNSNFFVTIRMEQKRRGF